MKWDEMLRIFCVGVGGQGVLLATRLIGEGALLGSTPVFMSEVHGMAQRGGVVESAVVLGKRESAVLGEGEADIMLALEPLEALRALPKCHRGSVAVINTVPIPPFSVTQGGAVYPSIESIVEVISREIDCCYPVDALEIASRAGSDQAVNVVLVGFLTAVMENRSKNIFPEKNILLSALKKIVPAKLFDINKLAFEFGYVKGKELLEMA